MRGDVTDAGRRRTNKQLKIELLSQWKLEAESRKIISETKPIPFKGVDSDGKLAKVIFVAGNNSSFKCGQSQTFKNIKFGQFQI